VVLSQYFKLNVYQDAKKKKNIKYMELILILPILQFVELLFIQKFWTTQADRLL